MVGKSIKLFLVLIAVVGSFTSHNSQAQAFREKFGKNRIQYKDFDWNYYASENFEVYFYDRGQELARKTVDFLESEFSRITETIGYPPFSKTRVFLYNSVTDKQQSNFGVQGRDFTVGGQTNFVQSQLEVAYTGDYSSFKGKLVETVTDMLIQEMLYGGNIAEMFQSSLGTPIPAWFTRGVSSYVAYGWDKASDDAVREYIAQEKPLRFARLNAESTTLIGHSIWNFIAQRFGKRSISNILNLARIIRNEENSIERTLGIPFDQFMNDWKTFYANAAASFAAQYDVPNPEFIITGKNKKDLKYTDLKFSPTGSYLAYSALNNGSFEVNLVDMQTQKTNVLFKGGADYIDQEIDNEYPILSWADSTTLGVIYGEDGANVLAVKRIGSKGVQKIFIPILSKVQSFYFKDGGRIAVMTGSQNGVSDAFVYNLVRGQVRHITSDRFDDRDIAYIPGTNQVLFSSNRTTDSVYVSGPEKIKDAKELQFNIYSFDLDYPDSTFNQLTNSLALNAKPRALNVQEYVFRSDQQGIDNLYVYNVNDTISSQVTNFTYGIKHFTIDDERGRIAYVGTHKSKDAIYLQSIQTNQSRFSPTTPRRALEISRIVAARRQAENPGSVIEADTIDLEPMEVPVQKLDSMKAGAINTDEYQFKSESKVNTSDYEFETQNADPTVANRSFLSIYQNIRNRDAVQGPAPYETRFQTDNVVTTWRIDELRGFSQLMEIQMNDYLENHRFNARLLAPMSFRDGYDVDVEYQYLKSRIDVKANYYRKSLVRADINTALDQRYNLDKFVLGLAYPFTQKLRVEVNPFFAQTNFLDRDFRLLIPANNPALFNEQVDQQDSYVGFQGTVIYDNTNIVGTNLHEGTRAKFGVESYFDANATAQAFHNFELDARHYQRINKGIYLAARLFYGSYFGDAPKRYLLGGIDNWLFNSFSDNNNNNDPLAFETLNNNSDILFHQFTNLRGYDYATFNGRNVLTFSGEVRFPINQLFLNTDLKSNFIKNLQIITFYDIGSAWDDLSPFKSINNQNLEEINQDGSPFSAVINNFNNPWLQSLGVGMRTMLFGFYSRVDVAMPIQNFETLSPKFQLSIGYDF